MKRSILLMIGCISSAIAGDNVLIITHAFNQPRFIEWQKKTFAKFIKDNYRFVVFNDASDENMARQIEQACIEHDVETIRIPQSIHVHNPANPMGAANQRHTQSVRFSLEAVGYDFDGIVCLMDSDLFFTRPFSFNEELEGYSFLSLMQGAGDDAHLGLIKFFAPAFCTIRMNSIPDKKSLNFDCGRIGSLNVDSGGFTFFYLRNNPDIKVKEIDWKLPHQILCPNRFQPFRDAGINIPDNEKIAKFKEWGFRDIDITFLLQRPCQINYALKDVLFHFAAGTNYDNWARSEYNRKMVMVEQYINDLLNS